MTATLPQHALRCYRSHLITHSFRSVCDSLNIQHSGGLEDLTVTGRMEPSYSRLATATVTVEMSCSCWTRPWQEGGRMQDRAEGSRGVQENNLQFLKGFNMYNHLKRKMLTISDQLLTTFNWVTFMLFIQKVSLSTTPSGITETVPTCL